MMIELTLLSATDLRARYEAGERDFSRTSLSGANLRESNLSGADLRESDLSWSNLRGANLSGADLRETDLSETDLRGANLSGSNLSGADLSWSNLSGSNLSGSNLRGANLSGANLSGANLSGAKGLLDPVEWLDKLFERDTQGFIVYKTFGSQYRAPDAWKIEPGAIIIEVVNQSPQSDCACGINVATRDWTRRNVSGAVWKCRIRFEWLIGAVVPYHTDGKFRTSRLELLEELSGESEVGRG